MNKLSRRELFRRSAAAAIMATPLAALAKVDLDSAEPQLNATVENLPVSTVVRQVSAYTIPHGKTGYLASVDVHANGESPADVRMLTRGNVAPYKPKKIEIFWVVVAGMPLTQQFTYMLELPALTDIWIESRGGDADIWTGVGYDGANTEVTADMEIVLFDD